MSPKNKGTFGRGKPPITEPDEFITGVQTTAERLRPYVPHIVIGSGAILLAAIAAALFGWIGDRRAAAATTDFAAVTDVTGQRVGMPTLTPEGELGDPDFETAEARAEAALAKLETLRSEHGSADIAERARLLEAKLLFELGRYGEAREAYGAVAESDAPEVVRVVAREGLGYTREEEALAAEDASGRQQGLEEALERFELMQPDESGPMYAYALYHQGRVLAALGRKDEARELFEEGKAAAGSSLIRGEIEDRLALLDVPMPAPKPAPEQGEGEEASGGEAAAADAGAAPAGSGAPAEQGANHSPGAADPATAPDEGAQESAEP